MMHPSRQRVGKALFFTALLGGLTLLVSPASAAAGPPKPAVVISFGYIDVIHDAGPLPEAWLKAQPKEVQSRVEAFRAGYKCKAITVLWAEIHRKDCAPVAYTGKTYLKAEGGADAKGDWVDVMNKAIAAAYKLEDLKLSFWTQHGRLVLGGVLLLLIIGMIMKKVRS